MPSKPPSVAHETDVLTTQQTTVKRPSLYKVILLNDDFTPMDFVVEVLLKFFRKSHADAMAIMLTVHTQGKGVAGIYTYEIAETKARQVYEYAKQHQYPLACILEKE